jgi:DNA-binding NtrC family response regulator
MKNILIVDDDPVIQSLFEQFLQGKGFSTRVADDGLQALLLMKESVPDLFLTDIIMDGMDGLALICEIRKQYTNMPIIAISGGRRAISVNVQPWAEKDGASEFMEKPIRLDNLFNTIELLLHKKKCG